ncbi:MAG: hypothetical protein EPN22_17565 [Nitrospirae bacterium]|nr:MAG: hypothetical protein EPN22_17565 [Nitrospirota bacterium]
MVEMAADGIYEDEREIPVGPLKRTHPPDKASEDNVANISTKELQENLVTELKTWQKTEASAVAFGDKLAQSTDNALIKMVAEIIGTDSARHAKIQQMVIDSLQRGTVTLSPDDLAKVWSSIEEHIRVERDMVKTVKAALTLMKGRKMVIQQYLLEYLMFDEEKHDLLLEKLEGIKSGMYPYG